MNPITAFFEWLAGLLKARFGGKRSAPVPEKSADEPVSGSAASPIVLHGLGQRSLYSPAASQTPLNCIFR